MPFIELFYSFRFVIMKNLRLSYVMIMEGSQLQGEKDSEKAGTIFKGHILLNSKSNQSKTETTAINILH